MSWTGHCLVGFDLTWFREGTAAVLEGELAQALPADCVRAINIRQSDAPAPFQAYSIQVEGDEESFALRHRLINSPYSSRFLHEVFLEIHAVLNRAVANRIRFLLSTGVDWPPAELRIPLHFPYLDRNLAKLWISGVAKWSLAVEETGRIIAQERDLYQSVLLLAGAARSATLPGEFTLAFEDQQVMSVVAARYRLPPLLRTYGLDWDWLLHLPDGQLEVTWSLQIPGRSALAWLGLPPERSVEFFEVLSDASIGMQKALRSWIPYTVLCKPERVANLDLFHAVATYSVMRPFRSNKLKQYVPDVLDRDALARSLKAVTRKLLHKVHDAQGYLTEAGYPDHAQRCAMKRPPRILEEMGRMPKAFAALVACESHLLDEMLRLAALGRTLAEQIATRPGDPVRYLWREGSEFHRAIELRLRRGVPNGYLSQLASLVLVETTRALGRSRGLDVPLWLTLTVRGPGGEWEWVASREIVEHPELKIANSDEEDPLE